jgi:pimeloyl-ACP methyl ester carboxylesterase
LEELAEELGEGFEVAAFQQRGLAPSTVEGPFTIAQALADIVAVLDALGWAKAVVVGHSWGGHLALRFLAEHPERLLSVLAVDPLGVAGDGGMAAFEAEIIARTPKADRLRARELDDRAMAGEGTPEESLESLRLVWPFYFADPSSAPPMPPVETSVEAYSKLLAEVPEDAERVAAQIGETTVPYGVVAGASSPMPWGLAARASAELCDHAFVEIVPGAGHFIWVEAPGSVRAALQRLVAA